MELAIALFTSVANLILGLITYLKNPRSATNRLIAFLALQIGVWAVLNYLSLHAPTESLTLLWIRIDMLPGAPMGPTLYLLVRTLPEQKIQASKRLVWGLVGLTIVTMALAISPWMFVSANFTANGIVATPGPAIIVFVLNFVGLSLLAFITLIQKFRKSTGIIRAQYKYLLLGFIATFTLIATTDLLFVVVFNSSLFVPFGPLYTLILVGSLTYAIVRHRFLDIRLVIARAASYTLLIFLFGVFYVFTFGTLTALFISSGLETREIVASTVLALVMVFSFQPIRRWLEKTTDKVFYRDHYETSQFLYDLTLIMASTLKLEDLTRKLLDSLITQMRVTRGAFILIEKAHIYKVAHKGYPKTPEVDESKISLLANQTLTTVFDELPEGTTKQSLRDLNSVITIPLRTEGEEIGLLALGEKQSGDIYYDEDVKVLEIIAPEAAVAIQNAKAYEEIRRFNITLQEEVDKATQELQVANEKLKELDLKKDEFVSLASHELRTPMTAIRSYLWLALDGKGGPLSDKQKYYVDRSYNSTVRLIRLVNDMLNISRIESGRITLNMQKIDLGKFTVDVIAEVKPRADELGLTIVNKYDDKKPLLPVLADPDKIKEVLVNLIGNSLKFTPKGGKITLWFDMTSGLPTIHITDSGEGISSDDLPKLFQKFGLIEKSYTTNQSASQGTGLGLYICKSIVELHGGRIWAESEGPGKGATFSFTLRPYDDTEKERYDRAQQGKENIGLVPNVI